MKFKFIIIFIILLSQNIVFALNILIIPPRLTTADININYMEYALSDILYKNLLLFSKSSVIIEKDNKLDYQNTKGNITKIKNSYDTDVIITYSVQKYKNGYLLNSFIYSKDKPKNWYEYSFYSDEDNFYKSINKFLDSIYSYCNIEISTKKNYKLDSQTYMPLIVYYNDLLNVSILKDYELYKRFTTFHKNNLYFNIDYLNFLNATFDFNDYDKVLKELESILSKNHHYINYIHSQGYYNNYKKLGQIEDINNAIKYIKLSIAENDKNYVYFNLLGDIYLLKNDYESAIREYKNSIEIYNKNIPALNNLIFIYVKDINKNTEEIIEYSQKLISLGEVHEDMLEVLVEIYKNAGDRESELYYLNMLLDYINKELVHIRINQLGAGALYKYTQKQKNVEKLIKNIKDSKSS